MTSNEPAFAIPTAEQAAADSQPAAELADLPARVLRQVRRAEAWLKRGEPEFAEQVLLQALAAAPDHPELWRMRALVLHGLKRYADSIAVLREAIALSPNDQRLYNNLGSALAESGDMQAAIPEFEKACAIDPDQAASWFNLGKAFDALHRTEEAEQSLAKALACEPDYFEALVVHAETLRTIGRIDEAAAGFRRAARLKPDSVEAWHGLFGLKSVQPNAEDLAALEQLYRRPGTQDEQRKAIAYVYGLALEASGRHVDAFDAFVTANAIERRGLAWDAQRFSDIVDSIMEAFAGEVAQAPDATLGSEVIFLTGMPRSGSTLAEQILSAHPDVEGTGEIGELPLVLRDESARRRSDFPGWAGDATPEDWARLGADYLARAARRRPGQTRVFTDKTLSTWQFVGAARAMLPGARIVDCRREPIESCWSAFKHQFGEKQPFSSSFEELAAWWHNYDRLVAFWNRRYPDRVYRHDYEALIAEPEPRIRELLDHCGLTFDPACLSYHESRRDVRTASAAQVRQPLQKDTARSDSYGKLLDPLREALAGSSAE